MAGLNGVADKGCCDIGPAKLIPVVPVGVVLAGEMTLDNRLGVEEVDNDDRG
jgi:hypothetical protein